MKKFIHSFLVVSYELFMRFVFSLPRYGFCNSIKSFFLIANGAKIGKYGLIGANTLVTKNMINPDSCFVIGSRDKVVKQLDEKE